jgi:high frequency lysogenization protein
MSAERDQAIALAGVFQASALAQQLARRGFEEQVPFESSVRSLFIQDAINTASVYGGEAGVRLGLETMREKLTTTGKPADLEIARYVLGLSQLGVRLARNGPMSQTVANEVDKLGPEVRRQNGEGLNSTVYAELARIYKDTISDLKPRIIVQGDHGHLSSPVVIDKVRTILFAGVRSAFLWNQLGGRRWHLVLRRKQTLTLVEHILELLISTAEKEGD